MQNVYLGIKIVHIAAGSLALLSGLAAILLRKNVKRHRPAGRIYFWCMSIIFITSLFMALYKFILFLFFINIFTFHSAFTAWRSLKLKKLHEGQKPLWFDWLAEILNGSANTGLLIFGIYYAINYSWQGGTIAIVFGLIGLRNSYAMYDKLKGKIQNKNHWLISHIAGMLGSYIGAITAFTVNNNRWMGLPDIVAWLGPTLVLVPFVVYETSKYKVKKTQAV